MSANKNQANQVNQRHQRSISELRLEDLITAVSSLVTFSSGQVSTKGHANNRVKFADEVGLIIKSIVVDSMRKGIFLFKSHSRLAHTHEAGKFLGGQADLCLVCSLLLDIFAWK